MNRATLVYLGMLLVLIAGLWAILRVGSRIEPPHDLDGSWSARPIDASPDADPVRMEIIQSGRFLTLHLVDMPTLNLRLKSQERDGTGRVASLHWEGGGAYLVVRLPTPPEMSEEKARYWFQLEEPKRMTWRARKLSGEELTVVTSTSEGH